MPRIISAGLAASLTVLLMTTDLQAQSSGETQAASVQQEITLLQEQSDQAYQDEKWVAFYVANMKMNKLRPFERDYLVNMVRACSLLDRKSTAYHYMLQMQKQGLSYDFNSTEDTLKIRDTEAYQYINDLLIAAGTPSGAGETAFSLEGSPADFRAIAWDASRDRFLVGTISEGLVMAVSAGGDSEVLIKADGENGLWSITDLAVDTERNRLWVSTTATPLFSGFAEADTNRGALVEYDLATLEQVGRYELPADGLDHELGSMALTADGGVYVIDRATPIIYHKAPGVDRLGGYFTSPDLGALRDIAAVPDNSRVFVSDANKGVMVIDPLGKQAALLAGPETMNLGGIEAIEYRDGQFFIVQGMFEPQRVIRLQIGADGATVDSVSPMAIALDEFNQPGVSSIQGDSLYYFANPGASEAARAVVMRTPLDAGNEVTPPDMALFGDAIKAQSQ